MMGKGVSSSLSKPDRVGLQKQCCPLPENHAGETKLTLSKDFFPYDKKGTIRMVPLISFFLIP